MQHIVHSGALFSASLSDLIDRFWRSYALLIDNSIQFLKEQIRTSVHLPLV